MGIKEDLDRLYERAAALEQSIKAIDNEIERATHSLAGDGDPGRLISMLQERHATQLGFMFDLGKFEAQAEYLENRIREEQEQTNEQGAVADWSEQRPLTGENHLDWFDQSPANDPPAVDVREIAEQDMLNDVERETEPDHLDWFPRR